MNGRLNRLAYFGRSLVVSVAAGVLSTGIAFALAFSESTASAGLFLSTLVMIAGVAATLVFVVKRLHDIERPGWHALLIAVPIYNLYLALLLLFQKGTDGPNPYGADPLAMRA
jgi:uncharacterized membrane protein YhaH (DUF805 family)